MSEDQRRKEKWFSDYTWLLSLESDSPYRSSLNKCFAKLAAFADFEISGLIICFEWGVFPE